MATKERLDALVVRLGHYPSREQAQRAILAGCVKVGGQVVSKPGHSVDPTLPLEIDRPESRWVSRGAHKLLGAMERFGLSVEGRRALDVGASTGGFTQVLLRHGAAHVTAIDVGYGQFAWELRQDPRVTVRERTNVRHLGPADLAGPRADLAVIDVSFIGLAKVLPAVRGLLDPPGEIVALVKPQFEAGPQDVGKGGVVRDPRVHARVLEEVIASAHALGLELWGLAPSPLRGPEGNIEFLAWWRPAAAPRAPRAIADVVREAHEGPAA